MYITRLNIAKDFIWDFIIFVILYISAIQLLTNLDRGIAIVYICS